jgi:hypothetical protein
LAIKDGVIKEVIAKVAGPVIFAFCRVVTFASQPKKQALAPMGKELKGLSESPT